MTNEELVSIIVKMREALDILKQKWFESKDDLVMTEFAEAKADPRHWLNTVIEAESLSQPWRSKCAKLN